MSTQKQSFKQNLIEEFSSESAKPDQKFKNNLEERLVRELDGNPQNNLILSLFNMSKTKYAVAISITLLIAVVIGGVFGFPYAKDYYIRETVDVNEILAKALKNKEGLNNNSQRYGALATAAGDSSMPLPESDYLSYFPDRDSYNHSKQTFKYGPAIDRCDAMAMPFYSERIGTSESFSYWESEGDNYKYYDKYIIKSQDGELLSYFLLNEDGSYSFMGGEYAILDTGALSYGYDVAEPAIEVVPPVDDSDLVLEEDVAMPVEPEANVIPSDYLVEVEVEAEEIDPVQYWGENQELLGTTQINGREHYIVSYEYYMTCDYEEWEKLATSSYSEISAPDETSGDKVISVVYIDSENSNISKEELYLGSIEDKNFISTSQYELENRDADFSEVKDRFAFEYNVEIKEVNTSLAYEWDTLLENIKDVNIDILVPVGGELELSDAYYPKYQDEYMMLYSAREFYPSSEIGDRMFSDANWMEGGEYILPELSINYSAPYSAENYTYSYADLNIFSTNKSNVELIKSVTGYENATVEGNVVLKIDGQDVTGELYKIEWSYEGGRGSEGSSGSSTGAYEGDPDAPVIDLSMPIEEDLYYEVSEYVVIFNMGGYKYLYHMYEQGADSTFTAPDFTTLNSRDDYSEIKRLIKEYRDANQYFDGGIVEPMPAEVTPY